MTGAGWIERLLEHLQLSDPLPWVLASFVLYAVGGRLACSRYAISKVMGENHREIARPIWWGAHLAYLLGIPYLALLAGAISPRMMGLSALDWTRSLIYGLPMVLLSWLLITIGWHQSQRPLPTSSAVENRWLGALVEGAAQQFHWAFYRAAGVYWLGFYWGTWVGVILLLLTWGSAPTTWRAIRHADQAAALLLRVLLAIVTAALYLLTPNWWLGWGLHSLTLLTTRVPIAPTFSTHTRTLSPQHPS